MVENNGFKTHIVVASPPTIFDPAVIARTLYVGLGAQGWLLHVVGLGRRIPLDFITYSRLPIRVINTNISFGEPLDVDRLPRPVLVVDPKGREPETLETSGKEFTILVDYTGSLKPLLGDYIQVRGLGLNMLTYEAIAVIYALMIRRKALEKTEPPPKPETRLDIRELIYFARRLVDAIRLCDTIPCIDFYEVTYALRNIYLKQKLVVDLEEARARYSAEGFTVELDMAKYTLHRLKRVGGLKVVITPSEARIVDDGVNAATIKIDFLERRACIARNLCVKAGEHVEQPQTRIPEFMFSL